MTNLTTIAKIHHPAPLFVESKFAKIPPDPIIIMRNSTAKSCTGLTILFRRSNR